MAKTENKVHLEIQTHRKKPRGIFRTTYYDNGKILHKNMGSVTDVDLDTLKLMQAALQGKVVKKSDFKIQSSKEYGASFAFLNIARQTGLDTMIYS